MQNKTEQLDQLFNEWELAIPEYRKKFIRDGIIDEHLYQTAPSRILFIMKEPNDPKQNTWDFREWWKNEIKYTFSYRIAEWSYGILNKFPQYDDILGKKDSAFKAIQYIAFMNIKKSGGIGDSDYYELMRHVKMNFNFLHKQIEIISPGIIITGTSWNELRDELFPQIKWKQSGYDIKIGKINDSKVIDFYHPSSRIAPAASYSLLQNIFSSEQFKAL